jgi:glycine cleavage system aminomethyltransferase T
MSLAFLSPAETAPDVRFKPVLRSSMDRRLREHGAEFEERDGWLVATRVPGEEHHALGVRDVTHLYAIHEGEDDAGTWIELGDGVLGHRVPSGHTFVAAYRTGGGATGNAAPEGLLDLSAAYAALEIEGPGAATAMRRMTALDLDELPTAGPVAHVRSYVFRTGDERFVLFFPQEYGHYLWEVAVDTVEPLGGGPAGSR